MTYDGKRPSSKDRFRQSAQATRKDALQGAISHHQNGRLAEAKTSYESILEGNPRDSDALHMLGALHFQTGNHQLAIELLDRAIALDPNNAGSLFKRGSVFAALQRPQDAIASFALALSVKPDFAEAHNAMGIALFGLGRHDEALASFDAAIGLNPQQAAAHNNRGIALHGLSRFQDSLAAYDEALRLRGDFAAAHFNRGNALAALERPLDALSSFDRAINLKPDDAKVYNNRGSTLLKLKRPDEALESFDMSLSIDAKFDAAHSNRSIALLRLNRFEEALVACERAVSMNPDLAEAHQNFGNALAGLDRHAEAIACFDKALELKPDFAGCLYNRALALDVLKRSSEALADLERALLLDPILDLHDIFLRTKLKEFDWGQFEIALGRFEEASRDSKRPYNPLAALALLDAPDMHKTLAEEYTKDICRYSSKLGSFAGKTKHDKISVGFFSSDFRSHPVSQLIVELIETLDRDRFDVIGFSFGPEAQDDMTKRLSSAFDRFIDVRNLSDQETAQKAREIGIDIAVDLNGHTAHCRTPLFAYRCAPVQVNYLGYPGTMGADFMDYIIADEMVIPKDFRRFYSEKIVYLPDTFLPTDTKVEISPTILSRQEMGLPTVGTVFCCFNNSYKITPAIFEIWMKLLREVDGSVLWLRQLPESASKNLIREANIRGIEGNRFAFAKPLPFDQHIARHRLADIFLDTFPYNAHTTAIDALRAGLPVLTYSGKSFASRVAASLLHAVGLPELVTESEAQYEAEALRLALDPTRLTAIRQKLAANLEVAPLFSTKRMARHVEAAFEAMHRIQLSGLLPQNIEVHPIN